MTRRWSLIATIAVLTVALAFVVAQLVRGQGAGGPGRSRPGEVGGAGPEFRGRVAAWHRVVAPAPVRYREGGEHDAVVSGGGQWTDGPEGGALRLDGTSGYADTASRLDTAGKDYSVAARVRLTPRT